MSVLDQNKPYQKYFEELTKIPHGSGNEKAISDFLVNFAKELNLEVVQDEANNVIVYKEASKGYEDHPSVMLQAHIDMVNEKNGDSDHDFDKDPLDIYIEDGYLKARGTTLGGDDGAGVAYIMAVLADESLEHPRLNALFTTGEEATMIGAFTVDPKLLDARRLINIDGEEEDVSNTASAGGIDVLFHRAVSWKKNDTDCYELKVSGLSGGHSGGEIHKEKGNANKIAARILHNLAKDGTITLCEISGGLKVNAIPREAKAVFAAAAGEAKVKETAQRVIDEIKKELEYTDNGLCVEIKAVDKAAEAMDQKTSDAIVDLIYLMPTGLRHKSDHLDGLTVASENIGVVTTGKAGFDLAISIRGALDSYVQDMTDELKTLGSLLGFTCKDDNWYPCWDYMDVSPLRDTMNEVYREVHGKDLILEAIHGGLECGIFKEKMHDLDIVTMGPNLYDVHTPDEKLNMESFDRTYTFLCKFLSRL